MKRTPWRTNLLIAAGSIVICLIIGEFALRILKDYDPSKNPKIYSTYDDTLGWSGKPGFRDTLIIDGQPILYETNCWGFRDDPPIPIDQTQGKHRVLFLGDSFVEGHGIKSCDRVSAVIKTLDTTLITYNLGVGGYSTDQELLVLQKFGLLIQPEVVVLFFCMNDLDCNNFNYAYGTSKPLYRIQNDQTLELSNVPVPERPLLIRLILWVKDKLAVTHYTFSILDRQSFFHYWIYPNPARFKYGLYYLRDSLLAFTASSPPRDVTRYLLRELKLECERQHAKLLVFTTAHDYEFTALHEQPQEAYPLVVQWCRELGIKATDLFPVFHQEFLKTGHNLFANDRSHWNALGNRLAARVVLDSIYALFSQDSIIVN